MPQRVEWACEKCHYTYFSEWFELEKLRYDVLSSFKAQHKCKEVDYGAQATPGVSPSGAP